MPSPRTSPHTIRPTDPFLRWMVGPDAAADLVAHGTNVAWLHTGSRPHPGWVTARGEDSTAIADLIATLVERHHVTGFTVPEDAAAEVTARVGGGDPRDWCWWVRDAASEDRQSAVILDRDDPRIAPLLHHSASAYVLPGDERVVRWAGVEDAGTLVAVAGAVRERSGAWHLVSVCTHPDQRGGGLAARACRALIDEAHREGAPAVVLEMYSDNEPGRRLYQRLGFDEAARFRSCVLDTSVILPF